MATEETETHNSRPSLNRYSPVHNMGWDHTVLWLSLLVSLGFVSEHRSAVASHCLGGCSHRLRCWKRVGAAEREGKEMKCNLKNFPTLQDDESYAEVLKRIISHVENMKAELRQRIRRYGKGVTISPEEILGE